MATSLSRVVTFLSARRQTPLVREPALGRVCASLIICVLAFTPACRSTEVGQNQGECTESRESRTRVANVGRYQERWTEVRDESLGWVKHGTFLVANTETGVIKELLTYRLGVPDGPYRSWDDERGTLVAHGEFRRGLRTGMCFRHWESGGKEAEGYFERDEPIGLHRSWYRNGQLHSEGSYALNKLNDGSEIGWWRYWHQNGQLSHEGAHSADAGGRRGLWQGWHPSGQLAWRGEYDKVPGVFPSFAERGPWVYWHANGQLAATGTFTIGRRTGKWKFWDPLGKPISEGEYLRTYSLGAIYLEER